MTEQRLVYRKVGDVEAWMSAADDGIEVTVYDASTQQWTRTLVPVAPSKSGQGSCPTTSATVSCTASNLNPKAPAPPPTHPCTPLTASPRHRSSPR